MDDGSPGPTRIVVPIDDSQASRRALPVAAALAEAFGGELVTVSHGRSRIGRRLIGSTAEQLLRTCPVPVIVFGPQRRGCRDGCTRHDRRRAGLADRPDRLVAPLAAWAPTLHAGVELVHARSPWAAELYVERATGRQPPDRPDLDVLAERLRGPQIAVTTHPMSATDPVTALLDLAGRAVQPTMIAVDTHRSASDGRHDVAYQLIRRAACPVWATTGRPSER